VNSRNRPSLGRSGFSGQQNGGSKTGLVDWSKIGPPTNTATAPSSTSPDKNLILINQHGSTISLRFLGLSAAAPPCSMPHAPPRVHSPRRASRTVASRHRACVCRDGLFHGMDVVCSGGSDSHRAIGQHRRGTFGALLEPTPMSDREDYFRAVDLPAATFGSRNSTLSVSGLSWSAN